MSDVFPLGDPPKGLTDNCMYILHIFEYRRGPKRFGVCVQHKNENASISLERTVMKNTSAVEKKYNTEFRWDSPSKRGKLIVESGDWENKNKPLIAKEKVNQSTVPDVHIYYPPMHTGAAITIKVKLLNEDNKNLLRETIPVVVNLNLPESHLQLTETRPGVEHPSDNTATSLDD